MYVPQCVTACGNSSSQPAGHRPLPPGGGLCRLLCWHRPLPMGQLAPHSWHRPLPSGADGMLRGCISFNLNCPPVGANAGSTPAIPPAECPTGRRLPSLLPGWCYTQPCSCLLSTLLAAPPSPTASRFHAPTGWVAASTYNTHMAHAILSNCKQGHQYWQAGQLQKGRGDPALKEHPRKQQTKVWPGGPTATGVRGGVQGGQEGGSRGEGGGPKTNWACWQLRVTKEPIRRQSLFEVVDKT